MPLSVGTRIGPYDVAALIGAGRMSACGHAGVPSAAAALGWRAEPRTSESEARHQRQFRVGWGPTRSE